MSDEHSMKWRFLLSWNYWLRFFLDSTSSIFWTFIAFLLPLVLILFIFCCAKTGRSHVPSKTMEENERENAITKMVAIITAFYFILWLPYNFLNIKRAFFSETAENSEEFFKKSELYTKYDRSRYNLNHFYAFI